jgi:hypothetical protein
VSRLGQAERGFRFGSPPPSRDEGQGRQGEVQQRRRRGFAAAGFRYRWMMMMRSRRVCTGTPVHYEQTGRLTCKSEQA